VSNGGEREPRSSIPGSARLKSPEVEGKGDTSINTPLPYLWQQFGNKKVRATGESLKTG
jgi:hypothetical protein